MDVSRVPIQNYHRYRKIGRLYSRFLSSVIRSRKETFKVEATQFNDATRMHRYACQGISVNPNPPRVGEVTTLALALKNTGPEAITINRIQFMVAAGFGMGLGWEQLPPIEHLILPADPQHVEDVAVEKTPPNGGYPCVRVNLAAEVLAQPLRIGRTLQVIESTPDRRASAYAFRLGHPQNRH